MPIILCRSRATSKNSLYCEYNSESINPILIYNVLELVETFYHRSTTVLKNHTELKKRCKIQNQEKKHLAIDVHRATRSNQGKLLCNRR